MSEKIDKKELVITAMYNHLIRNGRSARRKLVSNFDTKPIQDHAVRKITNQYLSISK